MLVCLCCGHKLHLLKILSNVEEILQRLSVIQLKHPDTTLEHSDMVLLAEHGKQLKLKVDIFTELDKKVIKKTNDEEKLEAAVFESAYLQTMSEKLPLFRTH